MTNAKDPEYINRINDIINGIARRSAYKFKTKDAEEIAQDLWVKVLEKDAEQGPLDLDFVAHICYGEIVDIQRRDIIRNSLSLDDLCALERGGENDEFTITFVPVFSGSRSEEFISGDDFDVKITIDDLLNLFPKGTKERTFLEYWSTAAQVKDCGIEVDKFNESTLAHILGFTGTSNRAFKRFRREMREFVSDYFDYKKK